METGHGGAGQEAYGGAQEKLYGGAAGGGDRDCRYGGAARDAYGGAQDSSRGGAEGRNLQEQAHGGAQTGPRGGATEEKGARGGARRRRRANKESNSKSNPNQSSSSNSDPSSHINSDNLEHSSSPSSKARPQPEPTTPATVASESEIAQLCEDGVGIAQILDLEVPDLDSSDEQVVAEPPPPTPPAISAVDGKPSPPQKRSVFLVKLKLGCYAEECWVLFDTGSCVSIMNDQRLAELTHARDLQTEGVSATFKAAQKGRIEVTCETDKLHVEAPDGAMFQWNMAGSPDLPPGTIIFGTPEMTERRARFELGSNECYFWHRTEERWVKMTGNGPSPGLKNRVCSVQMHEEHPYFQHTERLQQIGWLPAGSDVAAQLSNFVCAMSPEPAAAGGELSIDEDAELLDRHPLDLDAPNEGPTTEEGKQFVRDAIMAAFDPKLSDSPKDAEEQRRMLKFILEKFLDTWSFPGQELPACKAAPFPIEFDGRPPRTGAKAFKLSEEDEDLTNKRLREHKHCYNPTGAVPFASPAFPVIKTDPLGRPLRDADGNVLFRLVVNLKKLNSFVRKHDFPGITPRDFTRWFIKGHLYSALDFKSFFNQFQNSAAARRWHSIITQRGVFESLRMPQGAKNATAHAGAEVSRIFRPLLHSTRTYVDDSAIKSDAEVSEDFGERLNRFCRNAAVSADFEQDLRGMNPVNVQHFLEIISFLSLCRRWRFTIDAGKCAWFRPHVNALGYRMGRGVLQVEDRKAKVFAKWPVPRTLAEARRFVLCCSYNRWLVPAFASRTAALRAMIASKRFDWSSECAREFADLRLFLGAGGEKLGLPKQSGDKVRWICETDASRSGVGYLLYAVEAGPNSPQLSEVCDKEGYLRSTSIAMLRKKGFTVTVVDVGSRATSVREQAQPIRVLELSGAVWAMLRARPLVGFTSAVTVWTDHHSLTTLHNTSNADPYTTAGKWAMLLSDFRWKPVYRPGARGPAADALSRRGGHDAQEKDEDAMEHLRIAAVEEANSLFDDFIGEVADPVEPLPETGKIDLNDAQNARVHTMLRHPSARRHLQFIAGSRFDTLGTRASIQRVAAACKVCRKNADGPSGRQVSLPDEDSERIFGHKVSMDIAQFNWRGAEQYCLVLLEHSQFHTAMIPLVNNSAEGVAKVLRDRVCHGLPRPQLQKGDRDSKFLADPVYTGVLKQNGVELQLANRGKVSHKENKAELAIRHIKRITRKLATDDATGARKFRSFHDLIAAAVEACNLQNGAEARVFGLKPKLVHEDGDFALQREAIGDEERNAARAAWWATAAERRVKRALTAQRPGPDPESLKAKQTVWIHHRTTFGGSWSEAEVVGPVWEQGGGAASGIVVRSGHKLLTVSPYQVRV